jgi:hypothetical protein
MIPILNGQREEETWRPADWKRLQRSVETFLRNDISVHLRCKRPLCPAPAIELGRDSASVVFLRCGCRVRYVRARPSRTKH